MLQPECLRDCNASCCHDPILDAQGNRKAQHEFKQRGARVMGDMIIIEGACPFLSGNACTIREENWRPISCEIEPGDPVCLRCRSDDRYG